MVSFLPHIYFCMLSGGGGGHLLICLMFKIYLKNTDCLCYSMFAFVCFDLLSNLHDQNENVNYFVIS